MFGRVTDSLMSVDIYTDTLRPQCNCQHSDVHPAAEAIHFGSAPKVHVQCYQQMALNRLQ